MGRYLRLGGHGCEWTLLHILNRAIIEEVKMFLVFVLNKQPK